MLTREAFDRIKAILGSLDGISYRALRHKTESEKRAKAEARLTRLRARQNKLAEEISRVRDEAIGYKYRVYKKRNGWMNVEIARGDTWEEVIAQLEKDENLKAEAAVEKGDGQ
jgi:hypothetical protein